MDFNKLISRFKQFGGYKLVIEYAKLGALLPAIKAGIMCIIKRQSFKAIYPEVLKKIEPFLIKKYGAQIPLIAQKFKANTNISNDTNASTGSATIKPIWFCWLQGIEKAPEIVHACYNSLQKHLVQGFNPSTGSGAVQGYEIKVIDGKNWKEYVELPEYIVKKWEKGRIPAALFSDLLRLELLIKYGGTWIDSTVLCTGLHENPYNNEKFLDADLFLFQYTQQGEIPVSISNWFITACTNNEVLMALREMLYAYWKDYDCTLDYYIFHLFFSMLSKEYPEAIKAMPYGCSQNSLALLHHWGEKFDQKKWDKLASRVCFHKLAFRVKDEVKRDYNNYYNYILKTYK